MFTTLFVQPIFNLLVLIYGLLPGHNFGLAIIIFTVLIRFLMLPLLRKQLHQTRAMRKLQPELKRIKKAAAGNRQKESQMVMELYKERNVNPAGQLGVVIMQLVIFIALYSGLRRVVHNPQQIVDFSYPFIQHLPWLQHLAGNIKQFDASLFGVVDLTRAALSAGGVYWPAMVIVIASAFTQFLQSKQLMPNDTDARGLRQILKEAGTTGKQAEQGEVNAAIGRSMMYFIPVMIFVFTVNIASALSLYWFVSGLTAYLQQRQLLNQDEEEMEDLADAPNIKKPKEVIEGEVIATKRAPKKRKNSSAKKRKRR